MSDLADYTTPLVPVSEWQFYLYKVEYFYRSDDTAPMKTIYLVSTDTHIDSDVQDNSPNDHWTRYQETEIAEVRRPRQVGQIHGIRMDESARSAGEREAKAKGLMS